MKTQEHHWLYCAHINYTVQPLPDTLALIMQIQYSTAWYGVLPVCFYWAIQVFNLYVIHLQVESGKQ